MGCCRETVRARADDHGVTREISCRFDSRKRVFPIKIVVAHWPEKRETKAQHRLYRWRDSGPAALPEGSDRRHDVSLEIAHPAANTISFDLINRPSARPL